MSNDRPEEPFLARWSRQKRGGAAEPTTPDAAVEQPPVDLSKLPDIETLTAESDIAAFLQKGVPEALQRLALRKMWSVDPKIRDFVEVAENQWDFNAVGGIPGLFQEIAPGTDVSAWLAQATQSVAAGPEVVTPSSVQSHSQAVRVAASQHNPPAVEPLPAGPVEASRIADPDPSRNCPTHSQVSETATELATPPDNSADRAHATRRRHGGALPR